MLEYNKNIQSYITLSAMFTDGTNPVTQILLRV